MNELIRWLMYIVEWQLLGFSAYLTWRRYGRTYYGGWTRFDRVYAAIPCIIGGPLAWISVGAIYLVGWVCSVEKR